LPIPISFNRTAPHVKTRRFILLALIVGAAVARPAVAQAPSVTGTWSVQWDSGIRTSGTRVIEVQRRSTGSLRLRQVGDSVTGAWSSGMQGPSGTVDQPQDVAGTMRAGTLSLHTVASAATRRDGIPSAPVTFAGEWKGASLAGVLFVQFGEAPPAPRRWEGVRSTASP
jgi:hypothetical protein